MRRAIPPLLRNLNERTVLETIRTGAPISRAEISRRSGISKPTVSLALQSLLEASLVREAAERPDGPGYGALYFEPVPDAALVLGLDVGARFVRGAVCDLAGAIRARQDVELPVAVVPEAVAAIERLRSSLFEASGLEPGRVDGVVVGVPGVVELAAELSGRRTDARAVFRAARNGDDGARAVVEEIARRIALHLAPIAAVADVELVVLGGGIGANGDLLLDPVSRLLGKWLPFPPRVEVSTLGEAAVLTGALAVGLQAALENVFAKRPSLSAESVSGFA